MEKNYLGISGGVMATIPLGGNGDNPIPPQEDLMEEVERCLNAAEYQEQDDERENAEWIAEYARAHAGDTGDAL